MKNRNGAQDPIIFLYIAHISHLHKFISAYIIIINFVFVYNLLQDRMQISKFHFCFLTNFYFFFTFLVSHLVMLIGNSWLCIQKLPLEVLWGTNGMPEIKPRSAEWKANALHLHRCSPTFLLFNQMLLAVTATLIYTR